MSKPISSFFSAVPKAAVAGSPTKTKRPSSIALETTSSATASITTGTTSTETEASAESGQSPEPNKRARTDGAGSSSGDAPTSPLSPEQARLIEAKRLEALAKRQQKMAAAVVEAPAPNLAVVGGGGGAETESLEKRTMGASWYRVLQNEFKQPYFLKLRAFLEQERAAGRKIFPPENDIYSWSQMCDFSNVRVVVLGQDPYINDNQAHGCAFSVRPGVQIPPSLLNMYKELEQSVPGFTRPRHGYLKNWCTQGVLLLNACLTVRAGDSNSHANQGWEQFTDAVVNAINNQRTNVVFLLWGAPAQKKGKGINSTRHLVLKAPHPSPLSASRGFFGCGHFPQTNEYLVSKGLKPIDWNALNSS